jgi:acid phosphatase family membrane protein YuiD
MRRLRPTSEVPLARHLSRVPRSTSFPSGHAASAAAFATGVALEIPALAAPVGALAAAVGASRVVTGVGALPVRRRGGLRHRHLRRVADGALVAAAPDRTRRRDPATPRGSVGADRRGPDPGHEQVLGRDI